jgi:Fe-S cluster assembly scaffold protein SufB
VTDPTARLEDEASSSKIGEDQLFHFQQRGIDPEEAVATIISVRMCSTSFLTTKPR